MRKIIMFSGSNNPKSINEQLLSAVAQKLNDKQVEKIKLTDYNTPIYSQKIELEGIPDAIKKLFQLFTTADGFIISSPEHNGLPSAFLKNIIDWISVIDQRFFNDKPVLFISTSPGKVGGATHLELLNNLVPLWGGKKTESYSLGSFNDNFSKEEQTISNSSEDAKIDIVLKAFLNNK
ncbi:MAG: NAD(P)H-dependent oxidoreductase [Flavobacteriaceae bacterium]|nr:NAD(P)H-dependent oxidoreductase [Flavobacteriaceae bacterium]